LGDEGKFNDCFAFTAFPGGRGFDKLGANITAALPQDWKDVQALDAKAVQYLRDGGHFQVAFVIDRKRPLFGTKGDEELKVLRAEFDQMVSNVNAWTNLEQHGELRKRVQGLKQKAQAKAFNVRQFKNMYLASLFAAYVTWLFVKHCNANTVGWFSDRDAIITWCDGLAYDLYHVILASICKRDRLREPKVSVPPVNPTIVSGGGIWYDPYIRVADYYAGGLSSWNLQANEVSATPAKYRQFAENVASDNSRLATVLWSFANSQILSCRRFVVALPVNATDTTQD